MHGYYTTTIDFVYSLPCERQTLEKMVQLNSFWDQMMTPAISYYKQQLHHLVVV